jgi:2-pyrone-4,6-dicarboxylate lactonase
VRVATETPPDLPQGPPPNPHPSKPHFQMPAGACDSHCHIFGPFSRFPLPADRSFTPNEAPETALRALHQTLGIGRAVIVQSQGHGFDHSPLLEALEAGERRYRGVALIKPGSSAETVARFNSAGICGARFNFLSHLGGNPDVEAMRSVIAMVRPYDWHVALHVTGTDLLRYEGFIASIEARVVIDHMARPNLDRDLAPCRDTLFRLLDSGRVWIKLSGADRISKAGPPYRDVLPYACSLAAHAPERMLWGTDWPHVNLHGPMPDDGILADLISELAPSDELRRRLVIGNPEELFGF